MKTRNLMLAAALAVFAACGRDAPQAPTELPGPEFAKPGGGGSDVIAGPIDLSTLGGRNSDAEGIDDSGHVVGSSDAASGIRRAFFWSQAGGMVELAPTGAGAPSYARAINDSDQVVGYSGQNADLLVVWDRVGGSWNAHVIGDSVSAGNDADINNVGQVAGRRQGWATVWSFQGPSVAPTRLPVPQGASSSAALAINDSSLTAGDIWSGSGFQATLWAPDTSGGWTRLPLGYLPGGNLSRVYAIGEVQADTVRLAGISNATTGGFYHAVRWTLARGVNGQWQVLRLDDLGRSTGRSGSAMGHGINTAGDVVGDNGGTPRYWLAGGASGSLPLYQGGGSGNARDINNARWVVGGVYKTQGDATHATLWKLRPS